MTTLRTAGRRGEIATAGSARPVASLAARRSLPHLLVGAGLVVVCALAFAVTALRVDPRAEVLALAGPVPAGHVLTDTDLVVIRVAADASLPVLPAAQRGSVVGRSVTLPLPGGSLVSEQVLGPAAWPPPGQAVVAVSLKRAPVGAVAGAGGVA